MELIYQLITCHKIIHVGGGGGGVSFKLSKRCNIIKEYVKAGFLANTMNPKTFCVCKCIVSNVAYLHHP